MTNRNRLSDGENKIIKKNNSKEKKGFLVDFSEALQLAIAGAYLITVTIGTVLYPYILLSSILLVLKISW